MSLGGPSGAKARGTEAFEEGCCKIECVAITLRVTGNQGDRAQGEEMLLHPDHKLLPVDLPRAGNRQICTVGVAAEKVFLAKNTKLSCALEEHLNNLVALQADRRRVGGREAGDPEIKPLVWRNEFTALQASCPIELVGLVDIELVRGGRKVGLGLAGDVLRVLTCSSRC